MTNEQGILIRVLEVLEKNRLSLIDPTMKSPLEIETADILVELKAYIEGVPEFSEEYMGSVDKLLELGEAFINRSQGVGCYESFLANKLLYDGVKRDD